MGIEQVSKNYLDQVPDKADYKIFEEALQCYIHGLHRACYIMIWISIIESLKRKLFQLANLNHNLANLSVTKIEGFESNGKSTDILILDQALACGLISKEEKDKLSYIWTQRCICAHPYNTTPTNSEIIHAIELGIAITLGKDLTFDKGMIDEVIDSITNYPYFITNDVNSIRQYTNNTLIKIPKFRYQYTFNQIQIKIINLLKQTNYDSWILFKLSNISSSILFLEGYNLKNDPWNMEKEAKLYPFECWIGFTNEKTWPMLPERVKDILINYLSPDSFAGNTHLKSAISSIFNSKSISISHSKIIESILDKSAFVNVCDIYNNNEKLSDRILYLLDHTNFYEQNDAINFLKTEKGVNFINSNSEKSNIKIGILLGRSAIENNFEASILLTYMQNFNFIEKFKINIFTGFFIDGSLRLSLNSNKNLLKHLPILNKYSDDFIVPVFENIEKYIADTDSDAICYQLYTFNDFKSKVLKEQSFNVALKECIANLLVDIEEKLKGCEDDGLPF
ncbi:hypothetical protein [Persicitalea jodogahamensis]|uniref:Uncharacterized protein n=1 Tax=Persicitalea jodogahamensis TaxID=402147 RepID=A0A8J3D1J2_9BACT|nr:hypothetical protein [Persicitalea jodogahamensis]GHB64229.1 hypothetical protein GCM10007390_17640 [Persicitalea jodogahamensis]